MGFELPPTRVVPRRTRWTALLVPAVALVLVLVGFASRSSLDDGPGNAPAPAIAFPTSGAAAATPSATSATSAPTDHADTGSAGPSSVVIIALPDAPVPSTSGSAPGRSTEAGATRGVSLPGGTICHEVDAPTCEGMARAAVSILPGDWPAVRSAGVWRSLLCDSTFDCPPRLLRAVVPVGSVVLQLADGGRPIYVDVVGWRTLAGSSAALQLQAWIAWP